MTNEELKNYYANLLILQYISEPNAYATIQALIDPTLMNQLPALVQAAFDIGTAVGVQLDVIGKYAGVTRNGYDFSGPITLDDGDFTILIRLAILQNNSGSSLADIQNLIFLFFPGQLLVFDHADMSIDYFFNSTFGSSSLVELFVKQHRLPKPMGVQIGALIYAPGINNLFGFRTYSLGPYNVHGFNTYSVYDTNCHWLHYSDAIPGV